MTRQQLLSAADWFREKPGRVGALKAANTLCVGGAAAAFFWSILVSPGFHDPMRSLRIALTCGVPFVLVSAARHLLDLPRPFEVYDFEPVLPREKPGRSFPSRHVFSICVIGTVWCFLKPWVGVVLLALGVGLAAMRVVTGLHFARDVLAGAAVGVAAGLIGMLV